MGIETNLVDSLGIAIEISIILSDHLEGLSECAPCHPVRAMGVASSNDIWSSLVHSTVDQEASSIRWSTHIA